MATSYISKVVLPGSATVHYIRDSEAQTSISNIQSAISALGSPMDFRGVATTAITDGATTPATYTAAGLTPPSGTSASAAIANGTVALYGSKEFVWDGSAWHEFGSAQISGDTESVIRADAVLTTPSTSATAGTPTRASMVSDVTFSDTAGTSTQAVITGWVDPPLRGVNFDSSSGQTYVTGVSSSGTASAVTGYTPTSQNLDLTSVSKINGNTSVSFLPVSAVSNGTFSEYVTSAGTAPSWAFTVSSETLIITGANGSLPAFNTTAAVCKSVTAGAQATATNTTYSNVNVADGTVSSSGAGDSVLTGLGAPATATVIKSDGLATKMMAEMSGVSETYKYISVSKTSGNSSPITALPTITVPSMTVSKAAASGQSSAYVDAYVNE